MEASRIQFACANPEKTDKTKEIWNNIISEEESKLDFEKHKAKPTPSFLVSNGNDLYGCPRHIVKSTHFTGS